MESIESVEVPKNGYKRGKRVAIVYQNDYGTLETQQVMGSTGTFIGSCNVNGIEHTRKMKGEKTEVRTRWELWQKTVIDEMERKIMSQESYKKELQELVKAIADVSKKLGLICELQTKMNSTLEDIALSQMDAGTPCQKSETTIESAERGLSEFLEQLKWFDIVNCKGADVYNLLYVPFVKGKYEIASQRKVTDTIKAKFADSIQYVSGGRAGGIFKVVGR